MKAETIPRNPPNPPAAWRFEAKQAGSAPEVVLRVRSEVFVGAKDVTCKFFSNVRFDAGARAWFLGSLSQAIALSFAIEA